MTPYLCIFNAKYDQEMDYTEQYVRYFQNDLPKICYNLMYEMHIALQLSFFAIPHTPPIIVHTVYTRNWVV